MDAPLAELKVWMKAEKSGESRAAQWADQWEGECIPLQRRRHSVESADQWAGQWAALKAFPRAGQMAGQMAAQLENACSAQLSPHLPYESAGQWPGPGRRSWATQRPAKGLSCRRALGLVRGLARGLPSWNPRGVRS